MNKSKKQLLFVLTICSSGFFLFYVIPFFLSIPQIFISSNSNKFVGFENIIKLFNNELYLLSLNNTLNFIIKIIFFSISIPLFLALILKDMPKKYKLVFLTIFLLPMVIPTGSMIFFWDNLFKINGFINNFLNTLNINSIDFFSDKWIQFTLTVIFLYRNIGFNCLLICYSIENIPKSYFEVAKIEKASFKDVFVDVIFINILPSLLFVVFITIINSFRIFREIYILFGSYPTDKAYMIQHFMNNMFSSLDYSKLVSASFLMAIIFATITYAFMLFFKKYKDII